MHGHSSERIWTKFGVCHPYTFGMVMGLLASPLALRVPSVYDAAYGWRAPSGNSELADGGRNCVCVFLRSLCTATDLSGFARNLARGIVITPGWYHGRVSERCSHPGARAPRAVCIRHCKLLASSSAMLEVSEGRRNGPSAAGARIKRHGREE